MKATAPLMVLMCCLIVYGLCSVKGHQRSAQSTGSTHPGDTTIPSDWQKRVAAAQMLATSSEPSDKRFFPSIGNGYVGTVINSDAIYCGGVYVGNGILETSSERARIPSPLNISVTSSSQGGLSFLASAIDFERAIFYRRFGLDNSKPDQWNVEQRWYAHRELRSILVHQIVVRNHHPSLNMTVELLYTPSPPSDDINFKVIASNLQCNLCYAQQGALTEIETPTSERVVVGVVTSKLPAALPPVAPLSQQTFTILTAIRTSLDTNKSLLQPWQAAQKDYIHAQQLLEKSTEGPLQSSDALLELHLEAWQQLWQSGIEIEGDITLAHHINSSLYYLLSSVREDYPWPPSPGGIQTDGYDGAIFWDFEMWMFPPLLMLHPAIARNCLHYRVLRIPEAMKWAQANGYNGTMFPWESAFSGHEVDLAVIFNVLEQHISGDIAWATRLLWYASGDAEWLAQDGYSLAQGIADFWASRATWDQGKGHYSIRYVVPPDEFAIGFPLYSGVINSVFTNYVAKISLEFAIMASKVLGKAPNPVWALVASNLSIPFDSSKSVHPEYDNFPDGNTYFGGWVKQADVILLGYPLDMQMPETVRKADLVYYEPLTDPNGPAMTESMYAVGWLELGEYDKAAVSFNASQRNMQPPFDVWSETANPNEHDFDEGISNFLTGAGGFLQSVVNGYGGLRLRENGMFIAPTIGDLSVSGWTGMKLRGIHYLNRTLDVYWNSKNVVLTLTGCETSTGCFIKVETQQGQTVTLTSGKSITVAAGQALTIRQ